MERKAVMRETTKDSLLRKLVCENTDLTEDDIRILLETSHTLPFISELEGGDTYVNVLTREGRSMVVAQNRHQGCDLYKRDIIGDLEKKEDEPAVYKALEQGKSSREFIGYIDSKRIMVRHTVSPIRNSGGQVIGSLTNEYAHDKEHESDELHFKSVADNKMLYRLESPLMIADWIQDGMMLFDREGICSFYNPKAEQILRMSGFYGGIDEMRYSQLPCLEGRNSKITDFQDGMSLITQVGDKLYEASFDNIIRDGEFYGLVVIFRDRTELSRMEEELSFQKAAVNEIHHRIKNNLQTIISLIGLEAMNLKSQETKSFSKDIIARVQSISLMHSLLAHNDTDQVSLKTMFTVITDALLDNLIRSGCSVVTHIEGEDVQISGDASTIVALVINEIIQNSEKYAFTGRSEGRIDITIEPGAHYIWITVADDGRGFDTDAVGTEDSGLGLKLMKNMVRSSLKGEFHISSGAAGTKVRFSMKTS